MSPSEFDLRAALREGEGDRLDPDSVLAAARASRHDRRMRIASVAGAVVIVGGIGAGVGLANLNSSGSPTADGPPSHGASSQHSVGKSFGTKSSVPAALATLSCPTSPERFLLPGGGGTGQFGGSSPLFGQRVAAMKVCLYPSATGSHHRSVVIEGADAQALARSMNTAATTPVQCPDLRGGGELGFEVLAVTPDGARLRPVTALPEAPGRITNGTAVRYQCSPPALLARLAAIPTN